MKCLLISRFNVPNIGDLVISNKLYEVVSNYGEVTKYNLSGNPYKFKDINNVESTNYSIKYNLINKLNELGLTNLVKLYSKMKSSFRRNNKGNKSNSEFIKEFDLVIIGGGNMMMSLTDDSSNVENFNKHVELAKQSKVPTFAMDIGIGPFKNNEHLKSAIEALNKCDAITFRDETSYKLFLDNGGTEELAFVSIDPGFLYEHEVPSPYLEEKILIGINVIDSRFIKNDKSYYLKNIENYQKIIEKLLLNKNICINLFTSTKEDQTAVDNVFSKFKNNSRVSKSNINGLKDLNDLYKKMNILIGTRMHSMIIAYTMHVPIIGFSWQAKVDSLFDIIDSREMLFKFDEIHNQIDEIIETVNLNLNNQVDVQKKIEKKLMEIRKKALINEIILTKYSS